MFTPTDFPAATGRNPHVAHPQTYCYVFRVADGRTVEVVEHCDTALVERVLTPPDR